MCIYQQSAISFNIDPKDELFVHVLYTCFVTGNVNTPLLLFQLCKYNLLPNLFHLCLLFASVLLGTTKSDALSCISFCEI